MFAIERQHVQRLRPRDPRHRIHRQRRDRPTRQVLDQLRVQGRRRECRPRVAPSRQPVQLLASTARSRRARCPRSQRVTDRRARLDVRRVREARRRPGPRLDHHVVAQRAAAASPSPASPRPASPRRVASLTTPTIIGGSIRAFGGLGAPNLPAAPAWQRHRAPTPWPGAARARAGSAAPPAAAGRGLQRPSRDVVRGRSVAGEPPADPPLALVARPLRALRFNYDIR